MVNDVDKHGGEHATPEPDPPGSLGIGDPVSVLVMPFGRGSLTIVLVTAMIASTFSIFALAVLASAIIDDLGVSRTMIGVIGSVNTGVGALSAPYSGKLTDRIGPRNAVLALLLISSFTLLLMGVSSNASMLIVAGVIGGIPQGWGNPATNALIAAAVEPGRRGVMTGIKQSGVTFAVFLAGATLPGLEQLWSWQNACLLFAAAFALFTVGAYLILPAGAAVASPDASTESSTDPLPAFIWRLGLYALLMGLASGSIGRFLALFTEESLGFTSTIAGFAVALSGLLGMGFRIAAARRAEHRVRPSTLLTQLSLIAAVSSSLLALSPMLGRSLLWPAVVLYALGHTAWNAVINLAVIVNVPTAQAGRSSGIVILGFLMGLTIAGPVAGLIVDVRGSYELVWWLSMVLAGVAAVVVKRSPNIGEP
jgi:predicted MFS family arabinose efflux permease